MVFEHLVKSCLSKKAYRFQNQAMSAVKYYNKKYNKKFRYYYCKECENYHLTTKPIRIRH
jgi:hypothetical protein